MHSAARFFMAEFLNLLNGQMQTPLPYGAFHICAFAVAAAAAVVLCVAAKDVRDRGFRTIVFIWWLAFVLFETYKQVNFSFNYNGGEPYWDYQWYAFPFQLCSSPLYVLPLVFLSKEGSFLRRASVSFMAFYSFFAGTAVMFYPSTVFISTIGINIQTMFWHGSQLILGLFFIVRHRRELRFRFFAAGCPCSLCSFQPRSLSTSSSRALRTRPSICSSSPPNSPRHSRCFPQFGRRPRGPCSLRCTLLAIRLPRGSFSPRRGS